MTGPPATHPSHLEWTEEARAHLTDSLAEGIGQAEAIARRVFGVPDRVPISVEYSIDPEIPQWAKFVIRIPSRNAPAEAVALMLKFYSEALPLIGSEMVEKIGLDFSFERQA